MSEYQYVAFRAVDGPLDDRQLEFAESQSTRADVSRWSFEVEYHYSSFRGDVDEMLRNGYDVFLLFANYGSREVKLRLPAGLPGPKRIWSKYVDNERLTWTKDRKGQGGILSVHPFLEPGDVEQPVDADDVLDALVAARDRLLRGDLRPLYTLWHCAACDDYVDPEEAVEPPVPHGMGEWMGPGGELCSFFGIDPLLLKAAAENVPPAPKRDSFEEGVKAWIDDLDLSAARQLLGEMLTGDVANARARALAEIRNSQSNQAWPTENQGRSVAELYARSHDLREQEDARRRRAREAKARRDKKKAEALRAARMKEMAKSPKKWLNEAEQLVEARGTVNYKQAAEILYDMREAIGGKKGEEMTRRHAAHLVKKHPTLTHLKGSLRKRDLL